MESDSNLRLRCPQEALGLTKDTNLVGSFVKKKFEIVKVDKDQQGFPKCMEGHRGVVTEAMWVLVTKQNGEKLTGVLDNDPVLFLEIKCGDVVELDIGEVVEVLPGHLLSTGA